MAEVSTPQPILAKEAAPKKPKLAERLVHAVRELAREGDIVEEARQPKINIKHEYVVTPATPEAPAQVKAEFLPSAKQFFENCGLDASRINPVPLGEGLAHIVYAYTSPEGKAQVIKISKPESTGLMNQGRRDESENIRLITKYFGQFAVPTEIRSDPTTGRYVIIQDAIEGKPITNKSQTPEIDAQLQELMRCNRRLMKETGSSMDFLGVPGAWSWARHQFRRFFTRTSEFEVSNLLVDPQGKIRIIDYDMLRFRKISLRQRAISNLGFTANRFVMNAYFGVDMKPKV
jgi:hypothetical protein